MEVATITAGSYERFLFGYRAQPSSGGEHAGRPTLERCFTYAAHQGSVKCLASAGNFIASGGADDLIHVYDLNSGADLGFLMHPGYGSITCLDAFTPAGSDVPTHLVSGGEDGVVNIWEAGGQWDHLQGMKGHKGAVSAVALHPSGRVALSVGQDSGLRLWDLAKGKTSYCSLLATRGEELAWAQNGEAYCVLMGGKLIVRSVVGEGATLAAFEAPRRQISLFCDGGNSVVTGGDDGGLRIWDIKGGSCKYEVTRAHGARIRGIVAIPDCATTPEGLPTCLASASTDGVIKLWDVRMMGGSGGKAACALAEATTTARITCLTASPSPAKLKSMAMAQASADKAREAEKKKRIAAKVQSKAAAAGAEKPGTAPAQEEPFEVVPVQTSSGPTKKAGGKKLGSKGAAVSRVRKAGVGGSADGKAGTVTMKKNPRGVSGRKAGKKRKSD